MHDINFIRENPELFTQKMLHRKCNIDVSKILELDLKRRENITAIQNLQSEKNNLADQISKFGDKKSSEFQALLAKASEIKQSLALLEENNNAEEELHKTLEILPNIAGDEAPIGEDESANKLLKKIGKARSFAFKPLEHFEIFPEMMNFELASNISGARFVFLFDGLAKLERALANFMLDEHTQKYGYMEVSPPLLVKDKAMYGTGQLPKLAEDSFSVDNEYRLIPTSEVSLTNIINGRILSEEELPLRYTAFTPCFRSEAGSSGRDTKGMIRHHQFYKVELVSITTPEESSNEHERMLGAAENILKLLDLPYQIILLSTGDMGFSAKKTYDIEVWLPGQNKYREISSCSNCGDFQARRMKSRYNSKDKKKIIPHTLNGSGLPIGRTIAAILENFQDENGRVAIPEILVPYMGGIKFLEQSKK